MHAQRFRKWGKALIGQAIFDSPLHQMLFADSAIVITFHRVNNETVGDGLTCGLEMFVEYCRFFARHFRVVSLGSLVAKMESGESLNRELAITFDDGYRDNYEYAAPVLKSMGLPATFFVVTQFIGTEIVPWWDEEVGLRRAWMTWDDVRNLCTEGFEIGSHTRTHGDLGRLGTVEAWNEIVGSRTELEDRLARRVELFAYPYGREHHMTDANRDIVKSAGLRCCCSCFGGINFGGTDPYHLRRVPISSWYTSAYQLGCEIALRRT